MRLPTFGGLLPWEFEKDGREVAVRVEGALTFNVMAMGLRAALDGLGLGYCQADLVAPYVADGRLISVLEDWCAPFPGYHLYYPSRRQHSAAFAVVVEALRYRGPVRPAVARRSKRLKAGCGAAHGSRRRLRRLLTMREFHLENKHVALIVRSRRSRRLERRGRSKSSSASR